VKRELRIRLLAVLIAITAPVWPAGASAEAAATPSAAAPEAGASGPTAVVERLHEALLDVMKNARALGYEGRYERLRPVLSESFDLEFMAAKSVGRHWKALTPEEQKRWFDAFSRYTIANYAGRFDGYSGESFETLREEPAAYDTRVVYTKLSIPDDEDVHLNYRMRKNDDGWQIIDVYLDGTVSELALRRSEYSTVLQSQGIDELIASVEEKVGDLAKARVE
jgi:phospholipid transport system substrate-binding protein